MNTHPTKNLIPVETALADWTGAGCFQQKLDGEFTALEVEGGILAGETVRGEFTAFDCIQANGQDVRGLPLAKRLTLRDTLCQFHGIGTVRTVWANGAGLLAEALASGGEGVVMKSAGSFYEPMIAAKRSQIHTCIVTAIGPGQSITLKDSITGQARGKCPAGGGKADRLRAGSQVRVECETIHESGLFRSAKLCREWLVSF